jgi:hypothetical protein
MAAPATSPIGLQLILLPSTARTLHNLNSPGRCFSTIPNFAAQKTAE